MRHLLSDVRFAFRLMRRGPGFFGTLLAVLIAGIAATTAMFSIVESLLLRPLPYPDADQLTAVWRADRSADGQADAGWRTSSSIPDFLDWKAQATTFSEMAAIDYESFSLASPGAKPEHVPGASVSGDFFAVFGLGPTLGRLLTEGDDHLGGARVVVMSAALWHRRFGSDPAIVGRALMLNSEAYTVVGVAHEGFRFSGPNSSSADLWAPLAVASRYAADSRERGNHFLNVLGRRKPGVTLEAAQVQLTGIAKSLEALYPGSNAKKDVRLVDLHDDLVGSSRSGVWVLFAAVALVFVIVCSNVANLLLTRAQSRRSEMAARAALGATSSRLARQIMTETVVVFLLGSLGGCLASRWLVDMFASVIIAGAGAQTIAVGVDAVALAFSVVTCLAFGLLFGLVPALSVARIAPQSVLKESAARAGVGRSQKAIRSALVVAQVALAFALLVGSGLAVKAFAKVAATPAGFDPEGLATARIVLPESKYDDEKAERFYRAVIAKIEQRPGVTSVSANDTLPMAGSNNSGSFIIEGRAPFARGDEPNLERNVVTPGYFATMGIPLLRGREFTRDDVAGGRRVMVISQSVADRFFPGEDPIGRRIDWEDRDEPDGVRAWREIVGVSGDVRRRGLSRAVAIESYVPLAQHGSHEMVIVARSPRAELLLHELPGIVQEADPDQAVSSPRLMSERVADTIGSQRYVALLLGAFALAALFLAVLGVFGVVSYTTSQRTRELGIRMALGSSPERVVGLVMNGGVRLLSVGLATGLVGALLVGRSLAHRIPGVSAFDLTIYLSIPGILGAAGLVACLVPALRAVRIPPAIALRYE